MLRRFIVFSLLLIFSIGCASGETETESPFVGLDVSGSIEMSAQVLESATAVLRVENTGNTTTRVFVEFDADWIDRLPGSLELIPGASGEFTLEGFCDAEVEVREETLRVITNDASFEAIEVDLRLDCVALPEGMLNLQILGLPSGLDGAVQISGPTTVAATESGELTLPIGDYEVSVSPVEADARTTYRPEEETFSFSLEAGGEEALTVRYGLVYGALQVSFTGLPAGVDGAVVLTGPDYSELIEGSQLVEDLVPGDYSLAPEEIVVHPATYVASGSAVEVSSDETAESSIAYEVVRGGINISVTGLPGSQTGALSLRDPDGSVSAIPASGVVEDLLPGTYTVLPADVEVGGSNYAASEVDVVVVSGEVAATTITYLLEPGQLQITVNGLPSGVNHTIQLLAPGGAAIDVPQSGTFNAIEPGNYTIVPSDVISGLTTYRGTNVAVTVESLSQATATVTYQPVLANWSVTISGLPGGLTPSVGVSGPGGYSTTLTASGTLSGLMPGTYTVSPNDVVQGGVIYRATGFNVNLSSGSNTGGAITYSAVPGNLGVTIGGLGGLTANVVVRGPDNQVVDTLTSSQILTGLAPGTYQVQPQNVVDGIRTYQASSSSIQVLSETTATAQVQYAVQTGGLQVASSGLPAGLSLLAEITGPGGFSQTLTAAQTLSSLQPGDYEITFLEINSGGLVYRPTPASVGPLTVASGEVENASTTYAVVTGGVEISFEIPDDGQEMMLRLERASTGEVITSGTFGAGDVLAASDLIPGNYSLVLTEPYVDQFGNSYLNVTGLTTALAVPSDDVVTRTISAEIPTLVTDAGNDGVGSLREVIGRVVAGSEITIAESVTTINLTAQIEISTSNLSIRGHQGQPIIEGAGNHRLLRAMNVTSLELENLVLKNGFADGSSAAERSGGALYTNNGLVLSNVVLDGNIADFAGGAIFSLSTIVATDVIAFNNAALIDDGGAIRVDTLDGENLYFYDNISDFWGGAIVVRSGDSEIRNSIFRNNQARDGGALHAWSANGLTVRESLFEGNQANQRTSSTGGAIGTTFSVSYLHLENNTFLNNSALQNGGALATGTSTNVKAYFNTFVGNEAPDAAVLVGREGMELRGNLIAQNGATSTFTSAGQITSLGYNFIDAAPAGFVAASTDQTGTPTSSLHANLGNFGYNGGFPQTQALSGSSTAVGVVPAGSCVGVDGTSLLVDQRGYSRSAPCTIGAWQEDFTVEDFENFPSTGTSYNPGNFTGISGQAWTFTALRRAQNDADIIDNLGAMFRNNAGSLTGTISGGLDSLTLQYRKAFTGGNDRQFEIVANGAVIYTSPEFGGFSGADPTVYTVILEDIGLSGNVELEIRSITTADAQFTIDNLRWQ